MKFPYFQKKSFSHHLDYILSLVKKGGPEAADYPMLQRWFEKIYIQLSVGIISEDDIRFLRNEFGIVFQSMDSLFGRVALQPFGIGQDYVLIDKIYQYTVSHNNRIEKWDKFFQGSEAAQAIRFIKAQVLNLLDSLESTKLQNPSALNLSGGNGREIAEFFALHPRSTLQIHCIKTRANEIEFATSLLSGFESKVIFGGDEILIQPQRLYPLVWTQDLYAMDLGAISDLIHQSYKLVEPGGKLVLLSLLPLHSHKSLI